MDLSSPENVNALYRRIIDRYGRESQADNVIEEAAETHGKEFYSEIGHKGGEKTAETHGKEFHHEIGEKGGHRGGEKVHELVKKGEEEEKK